MQTLAIVAAFAVVAVVGSLLPLSNGIDARTQKRERLVVEAELAQTVLDWQERVGADANWDEALRNLDTRFDPTWAQENLTSPFAGDIANRLVLVLDSADTPVFAREHANGVAAPRVAAAAHAAAGLVAKIRQTEARCGARPEAGGKPGCGWILDHGFVELDGQPALAVAALVASDSGAVKLAHSQAPILLYVSDARATLLPAFAGRLLLRDARIAPVAAHEAGAALGPRSAVKLIDAGGAPLAELTWTPDRPGRDFLRGALPLLVAAVTALGIAIAVAYRQGLAGAAALRSSEARAHHLAFHDGLTGLPNRRLLNDRIAQAVARTARHGGSIALLMIDLDRFKTVNDTFGHHVGDEMIRDVSRRFARVCRQEDTCARVGGDEFVILAMETDATLAATLADRLIGTLVEPIAIGSIIVHAAASIGISLSSDGDTTPQDLLRQADLALYKAKDHARGTFSFFEIEMDRALQNRRGLENDLRDAIKSDALTLAYQPHYAHGKLFGVEALARWTHPQRGVIGPAYFVPLAEETGLIDALGAFVLRQAFLDSRNWPGLVTSINISAAQFRFPRFMAHLRALVERTGIDPRMFELEITESVLLIDDVRLAETLASVKALGFRLVLDDFGTGYSSLSYLGRFPIDKIKIDRSFINGILVDESARAVIRAIIALARALGLEVIAEGVQEAAQRDALSDLGCDAFQGNFFGEPQPVASILTIVHQAKSLRGGFEMRSA